MSAAFWNPSGTPDAGAQAPTHTRAHTHFRVVPPKAEFPAHPFPEARPSAMHETAERAARRGRDAVAESGNLTCEAGFCLRVRIDPRRAPRPSLPFFPWQRRPFITGAMTGELKQPPLSENEAARAFFCERHADLNLFHREG